MVIFSLLLQLLKIILYIVLALLALALLIILLVTFVPVSYKLDAVWKEELTGQARAAWLFGAVGIAVDLDSKQAKPWVFGFTTGRRKKKSSPKPAQKKDSADVKPGLEKSNSESKPPFKNSDAASGSVKAGAQDKIHDEKKEKAGIINKFKEMLNKWESIREIPDKKDLLNNALSLLKQLFRLAKPKVLRLRGRIGFEEPHLTGYVLGAVFALQGISGWDVQLEGDFNNKALELELIAKGRIWAGLMTWNVLLFALITWLKYKKYFKPNKEGRIIYG